MGSSESAFRMSSSRVPRTTSFGVVGDLDVFGGGDMRYGGLVSVFDTRVCTLLSKVNNRVYGGVFEMVSWTDCSNAGFQNAAAAGSIGKRVSSSDIIAEERRCFPADF